MRLGQGRRGIGRVSGGHCDKTGQSWRCCMSRTCRRGPCCRSRRGWSQAGFRPYRGFAEPVGRCRPAERYRVGGVRHEEGAALAAADQAKLTGRLAVCAGTTGPGSTHLVAGLLGCTRPCPGPGAVRGDATTPEGHRLPPVDGAGLLFRDVSPIPADHCRPGTGTKRYTSSGFVGVCRTRGSHTSPPQDVLASRIEHANLVDDSAPAAIRTSGVTSTSAPGSLRCRMTVGFPLNPSRS